MKRFKGFIVVIGVLGILAACTTAPITGRKQLSFVSSEQEMQLGLTEFEKLKKETPISRDPAANALLQKVGKRIAASAAKDLPNAQWEFVVFESKEPNAFCLPGGKIGVYTAILPITKDEAGLATVLGHEVAHAAAHHGAERMSKAMAAQGIGQAAQIGLSASDPRWQSAFQLAYPIGAQLGLLYYSREQESEADQIGLHYMARAGYNPEAAVQFWERFSAAMGKSGTPNFLRTHPVDTVRIADIKKHLFEAKQVYNQSAVKQ
jgi:metalloendopeptidase OMA1, mitochondrial